MRIFFITQLIFISFNLNAQEIKNIKVTQNDKKVNVNYSLTDSSKHYFIDLLYSENNGNSFSKPLKFVEGDIGLVKGGGNKSITWDGEKEIGDFKGEIIFRIKGTPVNKSKIISSLSQKYLTVELLKIKLDGTDLVVYFNVFSKIENRFKIYNKRHNYIIREDGEKIKLFNSALGDVGYNNWKKLLSFSNTQGHIIFKDFPTYMNNISKLSILIAPEGDIYNIQENKFEFTNIPIER